MKLAIALLFAAVAHAGEPCFKLTRVEKAIENDSGRYVLRGIATCPSFYLKLRFVLPGGKHVDTFESFHFHGRGAFRHELAYPEMARGFERVLLREVVETLEEAMR